MQATLGARVVSLRDGRRLTSYKQGPTCRQCGARATLRTVPGAMAAHGAPVRHYCRAHAPGDAQPTN